MQRACDYINLHNFRAGRLRPAQIAAGIEPIRWPYDRRHTCATWALRAAISIFKTRCRWSDSGRRPACTNRRAAPFNRSLEDARVRHPLVSGLHPCSAHRCGCNVQPKSYPVSAGADCAPSG
jgi:hypothetical protein